MSKANLFVIIFLKKFLKKEKKIPNHSKLGDYDYEITNSTFKSRTHTKINGQALLLSFDVFTGDIKSEEVCHDS